MTEVGRTALSVEIRTKASTPSSPASSPSVRVPRMLFLIASAGFASIIGTCLWAAAWRTTCGRYVSKIERIRAVSPMSATSGMDRELRKGAAQLLIDFEERELGALDQQQLRRPETRDLAGQLRADGAAGAGDHHRPIRQEMPDLLLVELDWLSPEQVLDLDVPNPRHLHLPLDDLVEARDDPELDRDLVADVDDAEDVSPRDAGDRDDDLSDPHFLDQTRQVLGRPENRKAVDHAPLLGGVIVDEPLHLQRDVSDPHDLACREQPGPSRADQQRRLAFGAPDIVGALALLPILEERPAGDPHGQGRTEGEHGVHEDDRKGDAQRLKAVGERDPKDEQRHGRRAGRTHERADLGHADVTPDEAIDAEEAEGQELDADNEGKLALRVRERRRRNLEIEAQKVSEHEGGQQRREVETELHRPDDLTSPGELAGDRSSHRDVSGDRHSQLPQDGRGPAG